MSVDVQMFVLCDHIIKTAKIENPQVKPILTIQNNENSLLAPGTYYVGNTYVNRHRSETMISPIEKIYVKQGQSLSVELELYVNPDEVITNNIYVTYTEENLTSTDLTDVQLEKENAIMQNLYFQDNLVEGTMEITQISFQNKKQPESNLTYIASYASNTGLCPRCYGKNYYFDIFFNKKGQAVTATKSQKLLQECLKVLIDDKLGNPFHPDWGCNIEDRIGEKNVGNINLFKVELSVREAIEYLQKLQQNNQMEFMNMHDEEMIDAIESIEVVQNGPTGYDVKIVIISTIGDLITYNVQL